MAYLVFIVITIALTIGWVALLSYESRIGIRYAVMHRANLDAKIERIEFLLAHVDFISFLRDETRHFMSRTSHDIVELTLRVIRAIERFLTSIVRRLRTRQTVATHPQGVRGNAREFIKKLSEFKEQLRRPEVPDIH